MALSREEVDAYLEEHREPSMTALALDFGYDPALLGELCKSDEALRYGMWRIIALAEGRLYTHVYGPKAVIERVERVLGSGMGEDRGSAGPNSLSDWVMREGEGA